MPVLFLRFIVDMRHDVHFLAMNQQQYLLEGILDQDTLAAIKAESLARIGMYQEVARLVAEVKIV